MPLHRLIGALSRQGLTIDSRTLWDQIDALARVLSPVHDALREAVLAAPVIGADETHWKLLGYKTSRGKTKRWQVWAIISERQVCYRIKDGRDQEQAEKILGAHEGVIVRDGYVVYASLRKQNRALILAHCWAHVRRRFVDVENVDPGCCSEVLDSIAKLFTVEARGQEGGLCNDDLLLLRQTEPRPIVDEIHSRALAQKALPLSPLGKAISYLGKLWEGLKVFLENNEVTVNNNGTERSLRGVVLGRKNHYGSRSKRGTEVAALFYSVIEIVELVGVDPYEYLRNATHAALKGEAIPFAGDRDHSCA